MMQWTLPSEGWGTPNGVLQLEQGSLAGRRYDLMASICNNPVCQCGLVSLRCTPAGDESVPPSRSAPVCLEMNVMARRIDNLEALESHTDAVALAKAMAAEMTDSDWNRLSKLYLAAKRHYTERADPDQIEAEFPAEVIAQGSMVGYYEILPFAAQLTVSGMAGLGCLTTSIALFQNAHATKRPFLFNRFRPKVKARSKACSNCRNIQPLLCVMTTAAARSRCCLNRPARTLVDES